MLVYLCDLCGSKLPNRYSLYKIEVLETAGPGSTSILKGERHYCKDCARKVVNILGGPDLVDRPGPRAILYGKEKDDNTSSGHEVNFGGPSAGVTIRI